MQPSIKTIYLITLLSIPILPKHVSGQIDQSTHGLRFRPYLGMGFVSGNFEVGNQEYFVKPSQSIAVEMMALYGLGSDRTGISLGIHVGLHSTIQSRNIYKFEGMFSDGPDYHHQDGKNIGQKIIYWGPTIEWRSLKNLTAFNFSIIRSWSSWETNQFDDESEDWEFIEKKDSSIGLSASASYGIVSIRYSFHVSRAELVSLFSSQHEYRIPITSQTNWIHLGLSL